VVIQNIIIRNSDYYDGTTKARPTSTLAAFVGKIRYSDSFQSAAISSDSTGGRQGALGVRGQYRLVRATPSRKMHAVCCPGGWQRFGL